jgi:hypothetical protein
MVVENQNQETMIPNVLRCLLTKDPATGRWNGHCLDFNIATSGKDPDRAWKNLRAVVRLHVEHCFTHWQDGLKSRAHQADFTLFDALAQQQHFRSEKITFDLVAPKASEQLAPLWIQGIELQDPAGVPQVAHAHVH